MRTSLSRLETFVLAFAVFLAVLLMGRALCDPTRASYHLASARGVVPIAAVGILVSRGIGVLERSKRDRQPVLVTTGDAVVGYNDDDEEEEEDEDEDFDDEDDEGFEENDFDREDEEDEDEEFDEDDDDEDELESSLRRYRNPVIR